jgi:23S rRNA pseudouridine2457 synthase
MAVPDNFQARMIDAITTRMTEINHRYFILHKPPNMVSQFVSSHDVTLLGEIDFKFPEGTHAIGRLDNHSEGLLLLTTNKAITRKLFQGEVSHKRKYLVLVRHAVLPDTLEKLRTGVSIQIKGGGYYTTQPCEAEIVLNPEEYIQISEQKAYEASTWLMLTLIEGKYHQVRKMVDAVGHKCKRLIRVAIEDITLDNLHPGAVREVSEEHFFTRLKLNNPVSAKG